MPRQSADRIDWISVVHEHKPAYDSIKRPTEFHVSGITLQKVDICYLAGPGTRTGPRDRLLPPVDPDYPAAVAYQLGRQKGRVTRTRTHVKDVHARTYSGLLEQVASVRREELRLSTQTL
jgi:hypothetical protein